MKKEYVVPNLQIVEFEINDIITHSLAMGDDSSGNNDISVPGSWGGFSANGVTFSFRNSNGDVFTAGE